MALSFCSNWGSSVINPATELFNGDLYLNTNNLAVDNQYLDHHQLAADYDFDYENHLLFSGNNSFPNLAPYSSSDNLLDSSYQHIKRRKSFEDCYNTNYGPNHANVNLPSFFDVVGSIPAAEFPSHGSGEESVTKRSVSVQSMAARQRRRKITEKTQELGKLVPGGTKMNTAEMFHAASKYVKWLQAQVAILQSMASIQEEEMEKTVELQVLLGSSMVQEKLYSEEKCLVPKKFVQSLGKDPDIQSKPWIVKDIDRLLMVQTKD